MDDFGLLVGRYHAILPTLADTQLNELALDSSGRLIISGRYIAGTDSWADGNYGVSALAVRKDADGPLTGIADGEYTPLIVDESGRLRVVCDLDVDFDHIYEEDSAHTTADLGSYVLAVREDSRPTGANTSASGDYASFFVNANGELYVHDTDALTKLTEIDTVLDTIKTDTAAMVVDLAAIEAELLDQGTTLDAIETDTGSIDDTLTSLTKAEDSVHANGDNGIMPLAVRNDAGTALAADGDYIPLTTDADGNLRTSTTLSPIGSEQFSVTDALAAAGDGLETITASATPWVTVATFAHTSGTAYLYAYQWACDQNAQMRIITDDTSDIVVYKTDINSSAKPGTTESWSDGGRIEIAGAANLSIKLQIKKRSATGGNANGTGSLHIRK